MIKELAGQLMARIDLPLALYRQLKEEHEFKLLKIYDPKHRDLYKKDIHWLKSNEILKQALENKNQIEILIREQNNEV